jgi:hypothetical protein
LNSLLGSASVPGVFTATPGGTSSFPEGEVSVAFSGIASYATFDFVTQGGRYIIDNLEGTFGSTEEVPEPGVSLLLIALAVGTRLRRSAR